MQYAYHYEFAFVRFGLGSRDTRLTTRSRETGNKIYALAPTPSPLGSFGIGLEYQWSDLTFSAGSQWNFIARPQGRMEYFSTTDRTYSHDTLTKGLAQENSSAEIFLQLGYSPVQ